MKKRKALLVVFCTLVVGTTCTLAETSEDLFDTLFGEEAKKVATTRGTRDDAGFAKKLIETARSVPDSPKFQAFLCERAYEFGIKNEEGYASAAEAIKLLSKVMPEKSNEHREKLVNVRELQYRHARGKDKRRAGTVLVEELISIADRNIAEGKANKAVILYRKAFAVASYVKSPRTKEILTKTKLALAQEKAEREIAALEKALEANPKDQSAAKKLLMLYLVEKDDPRKAAKMLDVAQADDMFRRFLPLAIRDLEDLQPAACMELGGWYMGFAEKASDAGKVLMLTRAKGYYERYLSLHTQRDVRALKAKVFVKQLEEKLKSLRGTREVKKPVSTRGVEEIVIEALIDGPSELWVTRKGIYWKNVSSWAKPGRHGKRNEPTYVNGKKWYPIWGKPKADRGHDRSKGFRIPIGSLRYRVDLIAVGESREAKDIERGSLRLRKEKGALVIHVDDGGGGSLWMRFRLRRPKARSRDDQDKHNKPDEVQQKPKTPPAKSPIPPDKETAGKLRKKVTLVTPYPQSYAGAPTDKISVQYAIIELLKQVGLQYNWKESYKNTNPVCRRWVRPSIRRKPCSKALAEVLTPVGLTYVFREGHIVLVRLSAD